MSPVTAGLSRRSALFCILVAALIHFVPARAANPRVIALMQPQNVPKRNDEAHWETILAELLRNRLCRADGIRVAPGSSLLYAWDRTSIPVYKTLSDAEAISLGEAIAADYTVWADFHRAGTNWDFEVRMAEVGSKKSFPAFHVCLPTWDSVIEEATKRVYRNIGLPNPPSEVKGSDSFKTTPEALDLLAQAAHAFTTGQVTNAQWLIKSALKADPKFAFARQFLATLLLSQGDIDEARFQAKLAVDSNPAIAAPHFALANVYLTDGSKHIAENELRDCTKLDADWIDPYISLADLLAAQKRWRDCISTLQKAASFSLYDPQVQLRLANAYMRNGDREEALAALRIAEHLPLPAANDEQKIADAFRQLNDLPEALRHQLKFVARLKQRRSPTSVIQAATNKVDELKAMMTPKLFPFQAKPILSLKETRVQLQRALNQEQLDRVTIPFACTEEMTNFARRAVGDSSNDQEKARRVFDALAEHPKLGGEFNGMTAPDAFERWQHGETTLTCQDFTFLYMALGRAVGLQSDYVLVQRDCNHRSVPHVCAGVAIGDKLLLVDLAYVWFGAPHQEFEVEDDIRVIAAHLAQSSDLAKEQAALTLAPDWAPAYFWASCNQSRRGLQRHAEGTLAAGLKLDSTSWVALLAQAFVETHAEAWEAAEAHLGQCIAVNPDLNVLKFYLATVLYAKGDVTDARDEFRSYLSGETTPQYESKAKLALAEINKSLASKLDLNKFPSKPSP